MHFVHLNKTTLTFLSIHRESSSILPKYSRCFNFSNKHLEKSLNQFYYICLTKKIFMKHLLSALLALTLFISCAKEKEKEKVAAVDYVAANEKEITDYIAKNQLTAQKSDTGLYYVITEPGTGTHPTAASNVTVAYKGYFTNGSVFDESKAEGISFGLNQVIKGWTEGIPYFKTGGSGILLVPAHLGYGNNAMGPIPGGSVLIFNVKLISVN
jgi:FKBP-type peptidyl-prolyl cis-trans isomerase FkpA